MTEPTMSNQRSVMTEFRFLDQKRQAEGLTAEETSRYAQLRDLVGPETAGPPRSGFDVNAAAAKLRESLLPAGLRARPAEAAPPPPAAEPPPPPEAPAEALALEQAWAEAPFAELSPEAADPLFDPGSMAQEARPQAWNPEAPGYDPNAPYDEAAWIAAGYDPNATYDWSAYGYGPDGQPLAADAGAPPPGEQAAPAEGYVAGVSAEAAAWDAEGGAVEVPEAGLAEGALDGGPVDAAPEAWGAPDQAAPAEAPPADGVELPWDGAIEEVPPLAQPPAGVEQDWGVPGAEPELLALGEVEAEPAQGTAPEPAAAAAEEEALPFDPNAPFDHAKWFGHAAAEAAAAPSIEDVPDLSFAAEAAPAIEPEAELSIELGGELPAPAAPAFGEYDEAATAPLGTAGGLDLAPPDALPVGEADLGDLGLADAALVENPPAELAAPEGEPSTGWFGDAPPATHLPAPAGAPFGAYDEAAAPLPGVPAGDAGLEAMLPFDPAAASAIEPGGMPEGYEVGGPALDPATLPPVEGGYDDADAPGQLYGGPEGDTLPGGTPLELGAGMPDWQPEAALEHGFELASDGSFGHADLPPGARTPAWGTAVAAPGEGWENAPTLDLAAPFDPSAAGAAAPVEPPVEELPTIDGAELLEDLPPEAPLSGLELGAEPGSPLDGAFEDAAAVEAAAYPPPDLAEPFAEAPALEPASGIDLGSALEAAARSEIEPAAAPAQVVAPAPTYRPEPASAYDPEPAISYEPAPDGLPPEIAAAYATPAASSDTFELPPAVADGLFDAAPEPEPLEVEPLPPPAVSVAGSHRVVLHTVDGQVKRGLLVDALLDAPALPLQPQAAGAPEVIPTEGIKAIFFMLAPGEKAPAPEGKKVRVTFRDGRQVAGFSPDYQEGLSGFFMIPADTRTNTGRIWVYQAAVKAVAVS
jgi:uncharacterized protein DUF6982